MRVERGEIRVSDVILVVDTPQAKVWHVDLGSKYARVLATDGGAVCVAADERTLNPDPAHRGRPTALVLDEEATDWDVLAECTGYALKIAAYQPEGENR